MRNTNEIQSVSRALRVLELLADEPGELGITELSRRLDVHKATASRLVATLSDRGMVERDPSTDKLRLGFGLFRLAGAAATGLDLVGRARPVLESLARATGETVNLAVLDSDAVVNIDQIAGSRQIVSVSWVGRRTPLHCTSNGKVLLAHLPEPERERFLAGPLERLTPNTITGPDRLREQIEEVPSRGYAFTVEELEVGLNAVAAPVRGADGDVVAAISVAGPAFRMTPERIPELGRLAVTAGVEASRRLGYTERRYSVG